MKKKFVLSGLLVFCFMLMTPIVLARSIGSFSISMSGFYYNSGLLLKEKNGSHVLNLDSRKNNIKVKNVLRNSGNEDRSQVYMLSTGSRKEYANWASKGYSYKISMARENWFDVQTIVTGSWSPDK